MRRASKALVTGGAGFIGSHIVDELLARGIETFVIDNLSTGSAENLSHHNYNKLLHVILGDARQIPKLLHGINDIDIVFHEAAIASVPKSISHPMLVHDVNVNMTLEILNYCINSGVKRIIFASSAAVYGIVEAPFASENLVCKPYTPYGASKLSVEDYLHAYRRTYGLETVALRYFNVYGYRQKYSDYSGVITIFINKLLSDQSPTIYGDGKQVRDFVHVKDIVQANMLAMNSSNAVGESFNVASGIATSIIKLLEIIKSVSGKSQVVHRFAPPRVGDVRFGLASIDKIQSLLGFSSKISMNDGLEELVASIEKQSSMAEPRLSIGGRKI